MSVRSSSCFYSADMDPLYHNGLHPTAGACGATTGAVSNGSVVGGVCDPHMNGLSLQEMIDTDIKADFDDVLRNNALSFPDSLELLNDLDANEALFKLDAPGTHNGATAPSQTSWNDAFGPYGYLEDVSASTVMVNPNNVMPVGHRAQQQHQPQHQHVQRLSVNTQFVGQQRAAQSSPNSPAFVAQQPPHYNSHQGSPRPVKTLKVLPPVSSPLQQVPGSPAAAAAGAAAVAAAPNQVVVNSSRKKNHQQQQSRAEKENGYPKPAFSYSCLIALALKNSQTGSMSVSEIYKFMW